MHFDVIIRDIRKINHENRIGNGEQPGRQESSRPGVSYGSRGQVRSRSRQLWYVLIKG